MVWWRLKRQLAGPQLAAGLPPPHPSEEARGPRPEGRPCATYAVERAVPWGPRRAVAVHGGRPLGGGPSGTRRGGGSGQCGLHPGSTLDTSDTLHKNGAKNSACHLVFTFLSLIYFPLTGPPRTPHTYDGTPVLHNQIFVPIL